MWPYGSSFYLPSGRIRTRVRAPYTGSLLRPRAKRFRGRWRLGVGGVRRVVLFHLGCVLNLALFNLFSNFPKHLLCQPSHPQPGHHPQLPPELCYRVPKAHRGLLCVHLLPWATSSLPKTTKQTVNVTIPGFCLLKSVQSTQVFESLFPSSNHPFAHMFHSHTPTVHLFTLARLTRTLPLRARCGFCVRHVYNSLDAVKF